MVGSGKRQITLGITITNACLVILVACASNSTNISNVPLISSKQVTMTPVGITVTSDTVELPEYLGKVWPSPDTTISLQEYSESLERFSFLSGNIGIGVELLAHIVAEEGDFDVNWTQRSSLFVDGLSPQNCTGEFVNGAVSHEAYDEQGNLLYRVDGPYYIAWRVPLEPGGHTITFQVRKTSGTVLEYSWRFTIAP